MKKYRIKILLFVGLVLLSCISEAAHIVGGDMIYECEGFNGSEGTFKITMTLYRDSKSGGAQFDGQARFGVYERNATSGIWNYIRTIDNIPVTDIENVLNVGSNPCLVIPPDIGVQKGVYSFTISLPRTTTEYMISYQRCCRNGSITNIVNSGDTGSVTSINISSLAIETCNDSPQFNDFPPIVICAGQDVNFDHSASDTNGDQLVYEFCSPQASGGTDGSGTNTGDANSCTGVTPLPSVCRPPYDLVQFDLPAYSVFNPMGGSPQVSINSVTGLISGVPNITGQFVVGICVKEYRNGVLIGEARRDFQFNVTACDDGVFASIDAEKDPSGEFYVINSCGDNVIDITNTSGLLNFIDDYTWEFDVNGDIQTFNSRDVTVTLPDLGTYTGVLRINDSVPAAGCRDTAHLIINLFPPIFADFEFDYDTCVADFVDFNNLSVSGSGNITDYEWNFGDFKFSDIRNPDHLYEKPGLYSTKLVVTDINNCKDSITYPLSYFPVPGLLIIEPSVFTGCQPANIFFNNLSTPIDSTYDLLWDFGDGQSSNELSPFHLYEDIGVYSVSLNVVSPIGCETGQRFTDWIKVLESPIAGFTYMPEELSNFNNDLTITDESEAAINWFYTFGDGNISYDREPFHMYKDTGVYLLTQVVTHPSGCTDTLQRIVDVAPILTLHMPNAFTPNNDGLNDEFKGVGFLEGLREYTLSIWNRWGEQIFETNDPYDSWDGNYQNSNQQVMGGVYVYIVSYIGPRGGKYEQKGNVTLIR